MAVLIAGVYIYYVDLGGYPLSMWDEGMYAAAARNALDDGQWIVPHLWWRTGYIPFLKKPPLGIWLQALSMAVFGVNEFAVRLPSATATIGIGILTYLIGRDLFDHTAGGVAALCFLTTPQVYAGLNGGRSGGIDMLLVFFGTVFVYALWRAVRLGSRQGYFVVGVAAAFGIVVKGFAFGIFGLVVLPLIIRYWRVLDTRETVRSGIVALGLVTPWFLYAVFAYGNRVVDEMFVNQVLGRVAGNSETNAIFDFMQYPYFKALLHYFDPYLYLLPFAVCCLGVVAVRRRDADLAERILGLLWWGVIVFGFFVFTGNHPWYIYPMYIPAGLLIGALTSEATRGTTIAQGGVVGAFAALLALSARGPQLLAGIVPRVLISPAVDAGTTSGPAFVTLALIAFALVLAGPALMARARQRSLTQMGVIRVAVVFVFVVALVTPPAIHVGNWDRTQRDHGKVIAAHVPSDAIVYVGNGVDRRGRNTIRFDLEFYAGRTLSQASIQQLNTNRDIQYAVVSADRVDELTRPHTGLLTTRYRDSLTPAVSTIRFTDSRR